MALLNEKTGGVFLLYHPFTDDWAEVECKCNLGRFSGSGVSQAAINLDF